MRTIIFWRGLLGLLIFTFATNARIADWSGIIPLRSTRSDVESLLGRPTGECNCVYRTENATVYVDYALDRCKGTIPGWNVPKETVLRLTVRSKVARQFSDLKLDLTKYKVRQDDTFTSYYSNKHEGIEYAVSHEGVVNSISYLPSISERKLRCDGFPADDGSTFDYMPFDRFGEVSLDSEQARLDTFAVMLTQSADLKAFIVVYAGKTACAQEAKLRANRVRDYLVSRRGLDPKRIKAIDGGYRDSFIVELFALPAAAEAPAVVPTISPSKVRIVTEGSKCRLQRHGIN